MKSATVILASLVAGVAVAQPHNHGHQHVHKRVDDAPVVWVTDMEYVTETIDITTTVWVPPGFVPPTTKSSVTVTESPAQFFEPSIASTSSTTLSTSTSTSTTSTSTSTSTSVAPPPPAPTTPTTTSVYVAPTTSSTEESAAPVPTPTTSTSEYVAPTTESTPEATSTTAPAPIASSAPSTTGSCLEGSPCSGDLTYYTAGLGACGFTSDGDTENVIALPTEFMGPESNGNAYCGKTVTITCPSTGKTTTATIVDRCEGCVGRAIDLSNAAFLELDDLAVGRVLGTWYINN